MRLRLVMGTGTTPQCDTLAQDTCKHYSIRKSVIKSPQSPREGSSFINCFQKFGKWIWEQRTHTELLSNLAADLYQHIYRRGICVLLYRSVFALAILYIEGNKYWKNPPVTPILLSLCDDRGAWLLSCTQAFKGRRNNQPRSPKTPQILMVFSLQGHISRTLARRSRGTRRMPTME